MFEASDFIGYCVSAFGLGFSAGYFLLAFVHLS